MCDYIKRMHFVLSLFVMLFCYANAYRYDYTYFEEAEGWLKLHQTPATWQDAYLNCFYEGGVLASPENDQMRLGMMAALPGNLSGSGVYTGVHATFGKGAYFSVEGTPLSHMPIDWARDEPDNKNNAEDCLIMLSNGEMGDVKCSETFPYFCYIEVTKNINTCGTVDDEYTLDTKTGSCYKVHRSPLNWTRAFVACAREGGYLAIINSATEAQVLVSLFDKARPHLVAGGYIRDTAFLGFRNFENNFLWMTIHGETITAAGYDQWASGQPDQFRGRQDCGAMYRNGLLDDNNCDKTLPFICEKDPKSLLSQPSDL